MTSITLTRETRNSRTAGNHFKPEYEQYTVSIGDGATVYYYSDKEPATVIDIAENGSWIKVQMDKATRIDKNGMSDCQDYEYERNEKGAIYTFKRTRKDKNVYTDNGNYYDYGSKVRFGYRLKYYDYTF